METTTPIHTYPTMRPQPWSLPSVSSQSLTTTVQFEHLAAEFEPISLAQMEKVALLNRVDTKFALTTAQLLTALARLADEYWMLEVNGRRLNHYFTRYFDTPGFNLYRAHVNGQAERYKVRAREYTDTGLSFLELKHKTRKDRTIKERILTYRPVSRLDGEQAGWLREIAPLDAQALEPKLSNTFTRITLVSKRCCERVTLDFDLAFFTADRQARLEGLAVAEVKQDIGGMSPFLARMRAQHIRPRGFSKYAVGVALLYDQVKKNSLKPRLLWIEKITKGSLSNAWNE